MLCAACRANRFLFYGALTRDNGARARAHDEQAWAGEDYYKLLGVRRNADIRDIKKCARPAHAARKRAPPRGNRTDGGTAHHRFDAPHPF